MAGFRAAGAITALATCAIGRGKGAAGLGGVTNGFGGTTFANPDAVFVIEGVLTKGEGTGGALGATTGMVGAVIGIAAIG